MLYREYDPEILKKLQTVELDILKDFDRFCEENEIDYFAVGGTAIGTVRHNGFIPWDDDIDIGMTRKNYNRLVEKFAALSDKYKLISYETTDNYPLMNTRLALKGTSFKEACFKNLDLDNGIFLDIFCFDNIFDDDKRMKRQGYSAWLWGKLLILWYIDDPVLYQKGIMKKVISFACIMMHRLIRLIYKNPDILHNRAFSYSTALEDVHTKRVAYMFDPKPFTSIVALEDIEPTRKHEFEDMMISVPCGIETYLKNRFGADYMTLPPEEDRHNHPPYLLEFAD